MIEFNDDGTITWTRDALLENAVTRIGEPAVCESTLLDEVLKLVSKWKAQALAEVPASYADRKLHHKYLKQDNYASGMDDCADELESLLDSIKNPNFRQNIQSESVSSGVDESAGNESV